MVNWINVAVSVTVLAGAAGGLVVYTRQQVDVAPGASAPAVQAEAATPALPQAAPSVTTRTETTVVQAAPARRPNYGTWDQQVGVDYGSGPSGGASKK